MAFAKFQENRFKIDKSPRGGHERRTILMGYHPFSHETSIFTLGAP